EVPRTDAWQAAQFERELARTSDAAAGSGGGTVRLADVRQLLEHRLAGRPTRANFRTGTLTVCTMVPMRSVPHRVVCLVGLDDGDFPRTNAVDGDDALARTPITGERDLRTEDRQLLLDAIMAAADKLVITYAGANEHTGAERPPAVPLGEVLDALTTTATHPERVTRGADLVIRHPLQPFDPRNLTEGGLPVAVTPFSFDRAALAGARAAAGHRVRTGRLIDAPLAARELGDVSLADLQDFFAKPIRHFLRHRLDVSSPLEAEQTRDAMPITLDGLEKWDVGDRLLHDMLDGLDPDASCTAELLRGLLPPRSLGHQLLREVAEVVQALLSSTADVRAVAARSLDVDIDLGDGRRLTGTVPHVHGDRIVTVTYSTLKARQRLESWIQLLALTLGHPGTTWTGYAVGRDGRTPRAAIAQGLDSSARPWLLDLVDIYDRGRREPIPLPAQTGAAYAHAWVRARGTGDPDPRVAARSAWTTNANLTHLPPGEQDEPAHVRVYGPASPLEVLLDAPRADESWNDADTRLGQYALRVWEPLLAHEELRKL
ncbi:MAG: exodeoxyribonuclease V subunit gamma, partial [Actinomycetota bacterium]|nr:exodeoxyribonuclease V subunit gamma [Actinomycetota bacterium]